MCCGVGVVFVVVVERVAVRAFFFRLVFSRGGVVEVVDVDFVWGGDVVDGEFYNVFCYIFWDCEELKFVVFLLF